MMTRQLTAFAVIMVFMLSSSSMLASRTVQADHGSNHKISGIVYTDEGVTPIGAGKNLSIMINGIAEESAVTAADGSYFSNLNVSGDDIVTVFIDGETEKGVTVDKVLDIDLTNVDVYAGHLSVRGRIDQIGTVDDSFNLSNDTFDAPSNPGTYASVEQADKKLVIAGSFENFDGQPNLDGIVRLNEDGSRDINFNKPEHSGFGQLSFNVALQQHAGEEKILFSTFATSYAGVAGVDHLVRLNANGTIDTTFTPPAIGSGPTEILVQPDGKILITGNFTNLGGPGGPSGVARLEADGTLDASFSPVAFSSAPVELGILSDGRIVVGGGFTQYDGQPTLDRIAVLDEFGARDPLFIPDDVLPSGVIDLQIDANDKIIVAGNFVDFGGVSGLNGIARINTDGKRDTGFAANLFPAGTSIQALLVANDGKILTGGFFRDYGGNPVLSGIVRFETDGTLDQTFVPKLPLGSTTTSGARGFTEDSEGRLLVSGQFYNHGGIESMDHFTRLSTLGGGSITNADLDTANDGNPDITALYQDSGGNNLVMTGSTPLTVQEKGWLVAGGNIDATDITNHGLIDLGVNDATISGDLTVTREMISEPTSTITFDGADQKIDGSIEVGNVTKAGGGNTLTIASGTVVTGEALTVTGDNAGSLLNLRTDPENGTNFGDLQFNSYTASFLDVQSVHASNRFGNEVEPTDSIDNGNTIGWYIYGIPGGVGPNLQFWLDANMGITETGGAVSNWSSQLPIGNGASAASGEEPAVVDNVINFNSAVDFSANNQRLTVDTDIPADNTTVFGVGLRSNTTGASSEFWNSGETSFAKRFAGVENGTDQFGYSTGFSFTGSGSNWDNQSVHSFSATYPLSFSAVNLGFDGSNLANAGSDFVEGRNLAMLGNSANDADNAQFGLIAETIVYNSNTVPAVDKQKIESYLGIKYGLTLSTDIGDYVDASGNTIYSPGSHGVNIVGIGRDDNQGLDQRVSKSLNNIASPTEGPILTIALRPRLHKC